MSTLDKKLMKITAQIDEIKKAMSTCATEEESIEHYLKYTSLLAKKVELKEKSNG